MRHTIDLQNHFKTALDDVLLTDFEDSSLTTEVLHRAFRLAHMGPDDSMLIGG